MRELERGLVDEAVKTLQMLAVDGVEKAASGHPGTPMALSAIAFEIWTRHLRYDPQEPSWPDRDRFVLSCGHASMLLYGLLHVAGFDLSLDELKSFRQWGTRTPGHPEAGLTPGVETTTGPLGQGISNAVGMAASLRMLRARAGETSGVATARVFGICSDGDLMEGVSAEASSLAGHLGLDNLIFFYDDNRITIDGATSLAFSEDVGARYEAYGWSVQHIDGHDHEQIRAALDRAVASVGKPSLIVARTHIGIGSPNKQDSEKAHGEPLGTKEVALTKDAIGWPKEPTFHVPETVRALFAERAAEGRAARDAWQRAMTAFEANEPTRAAAYAKLLRKEVPADLFEQLVAVAPRKTAATRVLSGAVEQKVAELVPSLAGGSADLNPSTKTYIEGSPALAKGRFEGRNVHFGIREHAMGSFVNGMAWTEGFIPFGSTFLVFSDYMRPAIRIAALSHLQSIFVFTHDSVFLGEDGPTHQPVEHYWALRLIPNVDLFRPCDGLECAAAWAHALARTNGPTVFALSRQNLADIPRAADFEPRSMLRGAYVLSEASGAPTRVLLASGSEVELAMATKALLEAEGERVRVVSVPCLELFLRQDAAYRDAVLPRCVPRVVLELGVTLPWRGLVGEGGLVVGLDHFGASAPQKVLAKQFGFTAEAVVQRIHAEAPRV
jgi:transketolase